RERDVCFQRHERHFVQAREQMDRLGTEPVAQTLIAFRGQSANGGTGIAMLRAPQPGEEAPLPRRSARVLRLARAPAALDGATNASNSLALDAAPTGLCRRSRSRGTTSVNEEDVDINALAGTVRYGNEMKLTDDTRRGTNFIRAYSDDELRIGEDVVRTNCIV